MLDVLVSTGAAAFLGAVSLCTGITGLWAISKFNKEFLLRYRASKFLGSHGAERQFVRAKGLDRWLFLENPLSSSILLSAIPVLNVIRANQRLWKVSEAYTDLAEEFPDSTRPLMARRRAILDGQETFGDLLRETFS